MRPVHFYGRPTLMQVMKKKKSDDSDLSNSDDDPDYVPHNSTARSDYLSDSSSSDDEDTDASNVAENNVPLASTTKSKTRNTLWRPVRNNGFQQYEPPSWMSQLPEPVGISSPIEHFKYFYEDT